MDLDPGAAARSSFVENLEIESVPALVDLDESGATSGEEPLHSEHEPAGDSALSGTAFAEIALTEAPETSGGREHDLVLPSELPRMDGANLGSPFAVVPESSAGDDSGDDEPNGEHDAIGGVDDDGVGDDVFGVGQVELPDVMVGTMSGDDAADLAGYVDLDSTGIEAERNGTAVTLFDETFRRIVGAADLVVDDASDTAQAAEGDDLVKWARFVRGRRRGR